jgi:FAD/FMN-containing dehydrogenase
LREGERLDPIDPEARTAQAQAGVLLGELDREAQAFRLAVPAGIVTHTGSRRGSRLAG